VKQWAELNVIMQVAVRWM